MAGHRHPQSPEVQPGLEGGRGAGAPEGDERRSLEKAACEKGIGVGFEDHIVLEKWGDTHSG